MARRRLAPLDLLCAAAFKARGLLMIPPLALLLLIHKWEWSTDPQHWVAALILFAPGIALRIWAQRHLRYRLDGPRELARTGPYHFVRNPVYLGNLVIFTGLSLACELPWAAPLVVGWAWGVYALSIRFEEQRLRIRYGPDYDDFVRTVPRWAPRLSGPATPNRPAGGLRCGWVEASRVEWQCMLLLLIPAAKEILEAYSPGIRALHG